MMTIVTTTDSVKSDSRGPQDELETRSEVHPARVPLPGTPSSGPSLASSRGAALQAAPSAANAEQPPRPSSPGAGGFNFHAGTRSDPVAAAEEARAQRYEQELARLRAETWSQIQAERAQNQELQVRLKAQEEKEAAGEKRRLEHQKHQMLASQSQPIPQPAGKTPQQLELEALERLAMRRTTEEAQKRQEDETRAQYLLAVQKDLEQAEQRARQAEAQSSDRATQVTAQYELSCYSCVSSMPEIRRSHDKPLRNRKKSFVAFNLARNSSGRRRAQVFSRVLQSRCPRHRMTRL
jgi:hypothetical protein